MKSDSTNDKAAREYSRCVIVGAAPIKNPAFALSGLKEGDYFIYCDGGLSHEDILKRPPDLIVGDFDSHPAPENPVCEMIRLPCEKDDTDTVFAVKEGIRRGFKEFLLLGAAGARLDHTLANISVLLMLDRLGLHGVIIDDYSELEIVSGQTEIPDSFGYFSVLSLFGDAEGVTETGSKYTVRNGRISCDYQYGVSNEVLPGSTAKVLVTSGSLLLIKVFRQH